MQKGESDFSNNKVALQNLVDMTNILEKNGCKYWLSDGTLLGAVREKNFISHDNDVDIAVFHDDLSPEIVRELIEAGFRVRMTNGLPEDGLSITFRRNDVNIDIFVYYFVSDSIIRYSSWSSVDMYTSYRIDYQYPVSKLKQIQFLGRTFWAPEDAEHYLELQYGKEWRVPNSLWSGVHSPYNKSITNVVLRTGESRRRAKEWYSD